MSGMANKSLDQFMLQRKLTVWFLFLSAVVGAGMAVTSGNLLYMLLIVAVPFVLILMYHPAVTFSLAMILDATGMQIPGVSYTTLGLLAKVLLIGVVLVSITLGAKKWHGEPLKEKHPLQWFAVIIIMLMVVRGSGLRALGSETWGGMIYVVMFIGIAYYFAVNGFRISKKNILWIVWGGVVAGIIGGFLQVSGLFVDIGGALAEEERLTWLSPVAIALFPLAFAVKFKRMLWVNAGLLLGFLAMLGVTGFRSRIINYSMVAVIFMFFKSKNKLRFFAALIAIGLIGWVGIMATSSKLPLGIQRAISFVPGVQVDEKMKGSAENSTEWRIEVWKYCLAQSKEYLLIGRGSAFDVMETSESLGVEAMSGSGNPWFAFQTRSYHSGPLSLLIDYGLIGLIMGVAISSITIRRFWGYAKSLALSDTFYSRYALYYSSWLIWHWISFYLIMGSMPHFSLYLATSAQGIVIATSVLAFNKRVAEQKPEDIERNLGNPPELPVDSASTVVE